MEETEKAIINKIRVREVIKSIEIETAGQKTYLNRDKQAYIAAQTETAADHSVGVTYTKIGNSLNYTIEQLNIQKENKNI